MISSTQSEETPLKNYSNRMPIEILYFGTNFLAAVVFLMILILKADEYHIAYDMITHATQFHKNHSKKSL